MFLHISFIFDNQRLKHCPIMITYLYPAKMFSSVDFPAPEGPKMQVNSPERSSPDMLWRMLRAPEQKKIIIMC